MADLLHENRSRSLNVLPGDQRALEGTIVHPRASSSVKMPRGGVDPQGAGVSDSIVPSPMQPILESPSGYSDLDLMDNKDLEEKDSEICEVASGETLDSEFILSRAGEDSISLESLRDWLEDEDGSLRGDAGVCDDCEYNIDNLGASEEVDTGVVEVSGLDTYALGESPRETKD